MEEDEGGNLLELYPYTIREKVTKTKFVENPLELKYGGFWKKSWELTTNQNRATICTYFEQIHCNYTYVNVVYLLKLVVFSEMLNMKHFLSKIICVIFYSKVQSNI